MPDRLTHTRIAELQAQVAGSYKGTIDLRDLDELLQRAEMLKDVADVLAVAVPNITNSCEALPLSELLEKVRACL